MFSQQPIHIAPTTSHPCFGGEAEVFHGNHKTERRIALHCHIRIPFLGPSTAFNICLFAVFIFIQASFGTLLWVNMQHVAFSHLVSRPTI